jgi:hypothetical protein
VWRTTPLFRPRAVNALAEAGGTASWTSSSRLERFLTWLRPTLTSPRFGKRYGLGGHIDQAAPCHRGDVKPMDVIFISIICGFFLLTWGVVCLCERV